MLSTAFPEELPPAGLDDPGAAANPLLLSLLLPGPPSVASMSVVTVGARESGPAANSCVARCSGVLLGGEGAPGLGQMQDAA